MDNSSTVVDSAVQTLTVLSNVIDYSYMIGVLVSFVFCLVLIKGLFGKESPLRNSFYFFTMAATASDILCNTLFYMLVYILEPLLGASTNLKTQIIYHDYIYFAIIFVARIFMIMDMTLETVLAMNRFTALVFPFTHRKVRLL